MRAPTMQEPHSSPLPETLEPLRDPADQYDRDAEQFMAQFKAFAIYGFGERCPDHDDDCYTCKLWSLYDQVERVVLIDEPDGPGIHNRKT